MMNPFTILTPAEALGGTMAIAAISAFCWFMFMRAKPTEAEQRAYDFGWEDGRADATPLKLDTYELQMLYTEGYMDGSRIRNRRADAETLTRRAADGPQRTES